MEKIVEPAEEYEDGKRAVSGAQERSGWTKRKVEKTEAVWMIEKCW